MYTTFPEVYIESPGSAEVVLVKGGLRSLPVRRPHERRAFSSSMLVRTPRMLFAEAMDHRLQTRHA